MTDWACDIAKAIARILESRNISDRELARMIGRSQNYVSIRLRCESPLSLADLDAIGHALAIDPASLLHGVPRQPVSPAAPTFGESGMDVAEVDGRDGEAKSAYGLAAKRGRRKAEQPHAE